MKQNKTNLLMQAIALMLAFSVLTLTSCKKDDEPDPENPIASFQFAIDANDYLKVTFTNFSQHATAYNWNFGDGNSSAEQNPTHTYATPGNYNVVLTASNSIGATANFNQTIEIKDPNEALALLAGQTSKTWKLYRNETSMGVGPNIDNPRQWWSLENTGQRPCVYYQEFTFNRDGQYIFDDKGVFWGEGGIFGAPLEGSCFEAVPANMIDKDGNNVSSWLGKTHAFTYEPSTNMVTINGQGAWIGIVKVGTTGEVSAPQNSVTFKIQIEQRQGYDYMHVMFIYDWGVWSFSYAHYHDPSLEPAVVEDAPPWGTDLPNITPTELYHTFESADSFALIGEVGGTSEITVGENDPAGGDGKVGKFVRVGGQQWQEAQIRSTPELYDIQFDNFNVVKLDIFVPEGTDFSVMMRQFVIGFADMSQTQEWWNSPVQFLVEGEDFVIGEWKTYEFDLTDVKARQDLDMIYIGIGGGGHEVEGIFYVRNLVFD